MVILAFPGMGKTPLAKSNAKYFDLDFGYFREAMKVPKEKEETLLPAFSRLITSYENDGYVVLTNDPKIMRVHKVHRMILPQNELYSARKMKVKPAQIINWISDWVLEARKHNVSVTFISVGLDHYLK